MEFTISGREQDSALFPADEVDRCFSVVHREANWGSKGEGVHHHREPVFGVLGFHAVSAEQNAVLMPTDGVDLVEEACRGVSRRGTSSIDTCDGSRFHAKPPVFSPPFEVHCQRCGFVLTKVVKPDRKFERLVWDWNERHGGDSALEEAKAWLHRPWFDGEGEPDFVVGPVHVAQALFRIDGDDHLVGARFGCPPPQAVRPAFPGFNRTDDALAWVDF